MERASTLRGEIGQRYQQTVQQLEERAELQRRERARQEAMIRERIAVLRAEAARRREADGDEDEAEQGLPQAYYDEEAAELTLSERLALVGTLVGSPAGIMGVVLGGAAGGAVGAVAEHAERVRSRK